MRRCGSIISSEKNELLSISFDVLFCNYHYFHLKMTMEKFKTVFQSVMAGSSRIEKEGQPGINVRVKAKDNITISHEFDDSLELNSTRKQLHSSKVFNIFINLNTTKFVAGNDES